MIEISHRQAQRLIRQKIDGPIPDEQWSVLQAHLEGCEECRAFQAGLASSERSIRRVLRLRWITVHGPRQALETTVKTRRVARKQNRKLASYLALAGVIVFLGMLYANYRRATAPPPTPTPNLAAIRATATPAPSRITFRGVAAYVTEEAGNQEIFLLNPGQTGEDTELVNMTNDPAADTHPAWSPDGEWLAFLSDRTGKSEVFVVHVAGSRLTQLTNDPGVQWQGPLSWSRDGAWIALTGIPISEGNPNEDAWVYLVPVGGAEREAGPRKLGLSSLAAGRVRFSPADLILAFPTRDIPGSLIAYDLEDGQFIAPAQDQNRAGARTGAGGAFDWSDDGRLAFLADGPIDPATGALASNPFTQVLSTLSPTQFGSGTYNSSSNQTIVSLTGADLIRQVAYVPGREGRGHTLVYLLDEDADGCWTLTLHLALEPETQPRGIPGLCVDGTFSRESFTPDGRWLVTLGHLPEGTDAADAADAADATDAGEIGLFAVGIPNDINSSDPDVIERLGDAAYGAGEDALFQTVVRPGGALLGITPRSVPEPQAALEPAIPPRNSRGQIVYSLTQQGPLGTLIAARPDGSGAQGLPADARFGEHQYSCPAISPDGAQIAFLSDRESGREGLGEVFVMDADGENVQRVARNVFARGANQTWSFDCPVWSPDGARLAAVLRGADSDQLAVIPMTEDAAVIFLPVSATSVFTRPVWSPDGTQVLLAHHRDGQIAPRITAVYLGEEGDAPTVRILVESDGWSDVHGLAYGPDGEEIAYVVSNYRAALPTRLQLRLMDANGANQRTLGQLHESRMSGWLGFSPLEWGEDNRMSYLVRDALHDKVKSTMVLIELRQPDAAVITTLAELEDVVIDTAWSPDRRWVMLASERGLLLLDVEGAVAGETGPATISGDRALEVDWR